MNTVPTTPSFPSKITIGLVTKNDTRTTFYKQYDRAQQATAHIAQGAELSSVVDQLHTQLSALVGKKTKLRVKVQDGFFTPDATHEQITHSLQKKFALDASRVLISQVKYQ